LEAGVNAVFLGWALAETAAAISGDLIGGDDRTIAAVTTDSRGDVAGDLFVALSGESFDGHAFASDVIKRGAAAVVVCKDSGIDVEPRIEVDSTRIALAALAIKRRDELDIPVIAITGSTGKTSTKDLLAAGLDGAWASPRSFNNEIGVPLTVLATPPDADVLVVEVGSRGRGHIDWLAPIIRPDVAVITNLGVVHLETFGSTDGLADAKFEVVDALGPEGVAVLPVDETSLRREGRHATITFGRSGADVGVSAITMDDIGRPTFTIEVDGLAQQVSLPLSGIHQAVNAAAAIAVAVALEVDIGRFIGRLTSATGSAWRMEVHEGRYTVVNDAYNANPQSVASALATVAAMSGRHIAVLGVMAELGHVCGEEHRRMGAMAGSLGFSELVVVGPDHGYALGYPGVVRKATDIEDAADTLAHIIEPGDVVLVKGSRSAGLEGLAHHLIEDSAT
jgi:UDP-N-acetylmuramoyl-tripeptide--D-alanyl-D-alanine ligase